MMFRTRANCYSINRLVQLLYRVISLLVDKYFKKKTNPQYKTPLFPEYKGTFQPLLPSTYVVPWLFS